MREQKVNDLILEESAGRTAGATYDADNNLVPLQTRPIKQSRIRFLVKARKAARQAYRNAALSTYAAIILDAKTVAENAYNNSPNDPNGVRGALEGYMDIDMDDEVKNTMPNIVAQFQTQERKPMN